MCEKCISVHLFSICCEKFPPSVCLFEAEIVKYNVISTPELLVSQIQSIDLVPVFNSYVYFHGDDCVKIRSKLGLLNLSESRHHPSALSALFCAAKVMFDSSNADTNI